MKAMNRRKFLKGSLLGGAAASVIGKSKNADASATFGGYPEAMGVLVDLTRCVGCRSCEAACNKEQGLPDPAQPFDDLSVLDHAAGYYPVTQFRSAGLVHAAVAGACQQDRCIQAPS